jgi:hypothetical protein
MAGSGWPGRVHERHDYRNPDSALPRVAADGDNTAVRSHAGSGSRWHTGGEIGSETTIS